MLSYLEKLVISSKEWLWVISKPTKDEFLPFFPMLPHVVSLALYAHDQWIVKQPRAPHLFSYHPIFGHGCRK